MSTGNKIMIGITALAIIGIVVLGAMTGTTVKKTAPQNTAQNGSVLWQPEIAHLRERLTAIGLPALKEEGTKLHIHQHLDIYVHGKQVGVPSGIGVNEGAGFISPIHIHYPDGVIHVESPTIQDFTLGQFFDIWGVKFDQNTLADNSANGTSTLQIFINGQKVTGDPRAVILAAHQEIVVVFGTTEETPVIPQSFTFKGSL